MNKHVTIVLILLSAGACVYSALGWYSELETFHIISARFFFPKLAKSLAIVHPLISLAMFLSNLFLVLVSEM